MPSSRLRLRPTSDARASVLAVGGALVASGADPNEAIGKPAWATTSVGDGAPCGRDSVAPTPRTARRRGPRRGDPCGRPSRIQHGLVSFVRGGVPRPCGVRCRPKRGHRETGMGDGAPCGRDSVAPTPRTARRRGPRRGDPCGRPSRIQHGFVSFVRGGVPRPCGVRCRPKRGHRETGMGDGAPYGRDSVGDDAPCGRDSVAPTPETWPFGKLGSTVRSSRSQER